MAEPERVRLPARSTRGKRVSELVGEDLDADEEFWNQKAFQEEAEDVEYATEGEVDEDVFDSDFDDDEPENEEEEPGAEVKERSASPVILSPAASPPSSLFPCLPSAVSCLLAPRKKPRSLQRGRRRASFISPHPLLACPTCPTCPTHLPRLPHLPHLPHSPAPPAPPAPLTCPTCPTHLPHLPHSPAPPAPLTCPTRPTKRRLLPPGTKKLSKKPKKPAKAAKKGVGGRTLVAEKGKASGRVDGEATGDGAEADKGKSKAGKKTGVGKSRQRRELALLGVGRVKWEGAEGEMLNREALAVMLAREEEVKRKAVVEKAIFGGPQIRFHSKDGKNTLEFTKVAAVPPEINAKAPSYPAKPTCVITGLPAKYRDPLTGQPYATIKAFKAIRQMSMAGGASSKEDTSSQEPPAAAAAISNAQNFSIPLFLLSTLPGSVGPQMAEGASRKEEAEESGKGGGEKEGRGRHGREGNIPGGTWVTTGWK
ncbi:unnamed protein product [Closterium sp. Naga37s-1]|nr:unnamed protein product [Closterium sp. Naga37s-1]